MSQHATPRVVCFDPDTVGKVIVPVLATDLRVAVQGCALGVTDVARGLIPGAGGVSRLSRQIPDCKAMSVLLRGDRMPVDEAWSIGLVNEVVPADEVLPRALAMVERITGNGPLAVPAVKDAVHRSDGLTVADALQIESEVGAWVFTSQDAIEGPRVFMERRPPVVEGR